MMERWHYEPKLSRSRNSYALFDRLKGHGDSYSEDANAFAEIYDVDTAQRIVDLLNAEERLRRSVPVVDTRDGKVWKRVFGN